MNSNKHENNPNDIVNAVAVAFPNGTVRWTYPDHDSVSRQVKAWQKTYPEFINCQTCSIGAVHIRMPRQILQERMAAQLEHTN